MSLAVDRPRAKCLAVEAAASGSSIWHVSAPATIRKAFAAGDREATWKAWQKRLRNRQLPNRFGKIAKAASDSLLWGLSAEIEQRLCLADPDERANCACEAVERWLDASDSSSDRVVMAIEALAWCHSLPRLATLVSASVWWRLWKRLIEWASDRTLDVRCLEEQPLAHQILAGELPLMLGYLFPELKAARSLLKPARLMLSLGLEELLDGDGLLHARHIGYLRPLLASWTRCRALAARWKQGCWSPQAEKQYHRFVRQSIGLSRRDGSSVFSQASGAKRDLPLLTAALSLVGDAGDWARASFVLPGIKQGGHRTRAALRQPGEHSEWAALAVLRPNWDRATPRLTVLYPNTTNQVELACGKDVLLSGAWQFEVTVDGSLATAVSEWSENCWVSDEDIDYLEIELELTHGLKLQRHLAIARKDGVALLADSVLGGEARDLQYRGILPLAADATWHEGCESREATLGGSKPRAMVMPLDLPEWKEDGGRGDLLVVDRQLELRQACRGRALFAPLFLDLKPQRFGKPLTWRRLTVAESLNVVANDMAVGYRAKIGGQQWLIYRSLARPQNRTVLGHNLSTEMLFARFKAGEVEALIEIE